MLINQISERNVKFIRQLCSTTTNQNEIATFHCQLSYNDINCTWFLNNQIILEDSIGFK